MYLAFLPIDHINHAYNLLKSYMMQFEPNTYKKSKPLYVINKENRSQKKKINNKKIKDSKIKKFQTTNSKSKF